MLWRQGRFPYRRGSKERIQSAVFAPSPPQQLQQQQQQQQQQQRQKQQQQQLLAITVAGAPPTAAAAAAVPAAALYKEYGKILRETKALLGELESLLSACSLSLPASASASAAAAAAVSAVRTKQEQLAERCRALGQQLRSLQASLHAAGPTAEVFDVQVTPMPHTTRVWCLGFGI